MIIGDNMNEKERQELLESLREKKLEKTSSFTDLMSRSERKKHERLKKEELKEEQDLQKQKLEKMKEILNENEEYKKAFKEKKKQEKKKEKQKYSEEDVKFKTMKLDLQEPTSIREQKKEFPKEEPKVQKKNYLRVLIIVLTILGIIAGGCGLGYLTFVKKEFFLETVIVTILLLLTMLVFLISILCKKGKNIFRLLTTLLLIGTTTFYLGTKADLWKLPEPESLPDFTGKNLSEVLDYTTKNNITVEQVYEYSDNIEEYHIISQNIAPKTLLKDVDELQLTISNGPNYDKEIILPNMVGWNIDDALKTIEENFLNNVEVNYTINEEIERDIIINQNINGQMKRSDALILEVSLGSEAALVPVAMIDLKGQTLFEATLWLKRNGIQYQLQYEFSEEVPRNTVISQNEQVGTMIDPKTGQVTLIISKGKEIIVPDIMNMNVDEVIKWITSNNLKVDFIDRYDSTIEAGKIIEASHKQGDVVEEGTVIKIVTSKGQLRMKEVANLNEFRTWASQYGINYQEEYEFNDDVAKGEVIRYSVNFNDVININDIIVVTISNGKAVSVPNLIGKTKAEAQTACRNAGLTCTFYYSNSSKTKDIVISQNKRAGSQVSSGTYVSVGLSNGNSGQSNDPTTPTTPTCDTSKTIQVFLQPGNTGSQTQSMIQSAYPNIKWNFNLVDSCSNGSIVSGTVCNASAIDEQYLNYCDTYTVTIVK